MTVVKCYDKLLEKPSSLILLESIPLFDILEHITTWCKLHGNPQVLICEKHFLELNYMRVQKPVVVEQLPLNILSDLRELWSKISTLAVSCCRSAQNYLLSTFNKLYRHLLSGSVILAKLHKPVRTRIDVFDFAVPRPLCPIQGVSFSARRLGH